MKLILSDRHLDLQLEERDDVSFVDVSSLKIANCMGCFGCWTKTPGKCVIRDDAVKVYPLIAKSERVIYVSHVKYGGYDTVMKTMLERAIPIQKAFIRIWENETHHVQRAVEKKQAVIVAYGCTSSEEKEVFSELVKRNAKNMNFESYRIVFAKEEEVEQIVGNEVEKWEK